jgi:hypothetical protein
MRLSREQPAKQIAARELTACALHLCRALGKIPMASDSSASSMTELTDLHRTPIKSSVMYGKKAKFEGFEFGLFAL